MRLAMLAVVMVTYSKRWGRPNCHDHLTGGVRITLQSLRNPNVRLKTSIILSLSRGGDWHSQSNSDDEG